MPVELMASRGVQILWKVGIVDCSDCLFGPISRFMSEMGHTCNVRTSFLQGVTTWCEQSVS